MKSFWRLVRVISIVGAIAGGLRGVAFAYFSIENRITQIETKSASITHITKYEVKELLEDSLEKTLIKEFKNFENRLLLTLDERYQKKN